MEKRTFEDVRHDVATFLTKPLERFTGWAESQYWDWRYGNGLCNEIPVPPELKALGVLELFTERLRFAVFVLLCARPGDDWTLSRAAKLIVCLLLGRVYNYKKHADPEFCYVASVYGRPGATSWWDLELDEDRWLFCATREWSDTEY